MASGGLIAALVGAGGALAFVAYKRKQQQQPAQEPPASSGCDALAAINPTLHAACKGASGIGSILGAIAEAIQGENPAAKVNRINQALNGPTKIPNKLPASLTGFHISGYVSLPSHAIEHTNGCRPFWRVHPDTKKTVGTPGFEKCAPGTQEGMWPARRSHPLLGHETQYFWESDTGDRSKDVFTVQERLFDGTIYDPSTGLDWKSVGDSEVPIPLDKPYTWYVKGEPRTCPAGQVLSMYSALRDKTGNPFCTPPDGSGFHTNPNAATGGGTAVSTGSQGTRGPRTCTTGPFGSVICLDDEPDAPHRAGGGVTTSSHDRPTPGW